MGRKLIAYAWGDQHCGEFKQFDTDDSRLKNSVDVFRVLGHLAEKNRVPLLFTGDLIENPKHLTNKTFNYLLDGYKRYIQDRGVEVYAIDGNHDQSEANTLTHRSSNYLTGLSKVFKKFHHLEYNYQDAVRFRVFGIPYLKRNEGFVKTVKRLKKHLDPERPNILLIHTDLPTVPYPNGLVPEDIPGLPKKLSSLFKGFDLVLSGHIHKKKRVSNFIYMLGAPQQQEQSEAGLKMGYWEIYSDCTVKFKQLDMYPEFKFIMEGQKAPDKFNYYIEIPKPKKAKKSKTGKVKKRFASDKSNKELVDNYFKEIGAKDKAKKRLLTQILDEAAKGD